MTLTLHSCERVDSAARVIRAAQRLPSETREGFAPWHPVHGFDYDAMRREARMISLERVEIADGWRIVPVTITITATGDAVRAMGGSFR